MPKTTVQPTTNDRGDESHPAWGAISAHRISSSPPGVVLFDSDVRHTHFVRVTIGRMTRARHHGHDFLHSSNRELIEVDMSEAQWASFVSSMNTSAVPCTLARVDGDDVPGLPYAPRLKVSMDKAKLAAREAFADIEQAMAEVDALDPKAPAKERREALGKLRARINNAAANVDYASRTLVEHTENVVQKARADIEAMARIAAADHGLESAEGVTLELEAEEWDRVHVTHFASVDGSKPADPTRCEICGDEVEYNTHSNTWVHSSTGNAVS